MDIICSRCSPADSGAEWLQATPQCKYVMILLVYCPLEGPVFQSNLEPQGGKGSEERGGEGRGGEKRGGYKITVNTI